MDSYLNSPSTTRDVILNFGHSETLQPMIAALGLYDDGRLLHVGDDTWLHLKLETNAIRRFRLVSLVSYSCLSLMTIALRTQFRIVS